MKQFVTEEDVEEALDYLKSGAQKAAAAKAQRAYLDDYTKVVKSKAMQRNSMSALGAQERDAYASREYAEHLEVLRIAVEEDEKHRYLLESARATIDAWRTLCATERSMKL